MSSDDNYFDYLRQRSKLGAFYRAHWLYRRLSRRLVGRTLDVGCGIGDMLNYRTDTIGVDINARTVAYCKARGAEAHLMSLDVLPFDTASFDSVMLDNVLEHLIEPAPLLAEIRRVLKPRGRFLVGVPGLKGWDSDPDHKTRYDETTLTSTVTHFGFAHEETFHTPFGKSRWLDQNMRQYCIYAAFRRQD